MNTYGKTTLHPVTREKPCAICQGNHKCSVGSDGLLLCGRQQGPKPGFIYLGQSKGDEQFALYRLEGDPRLDDFGQRPPSINGRLAGLRIDWMKLSQALAKNLTAEKRGELAGMISLPEPALAVLPIGFRTEGPHRIDGRPLGPCFTFPEEDGAGRVVGISCRYLDGMKKAWPAGSRGLTVPTGWQEKPGPIFLVEGPSDTLALTALNLAAVGRPSNTGGVEHLAKLLKDVPEERQIVVVGEWDSKPDGTWPGRDGAVKGATELGQRLGRPIQWALPPSGYKDVRAWVLAQNLDPAILDAWQEAGERLMAELGPPQECPRAGNHVSASEPWPAIIPLSDAPDVEPFPVDVLPVHLVDFVDCVSKALGCPADFVAVPMLTLAGSAVGNARALEIKQGWRERPNLFAAIVGHPGGAKSPALKLAAAPVYAKQAQHMTAYRLLKTSWEEGGKEGAKPKPQTLYVSDITTEALAGVLLDNSRGVVIIRDELTGWVNSLDQYRARGRGSDRQFYLSVWGCEPVSVHRKTQDDGPVFVGHPFVAVVGGLPPDLLTTLRGERAISDGFFDRILTAYPEPTPATGETWSCVPDEASQAWVDVLEYLWSLKPEDQGEGQRPHFVRLDASGRRAWEQFTTANADEMNQEMFPDYLRGSWSKHRGYCARLALIVHCLRLACGEVCADDVDGESVDRAARLIRYFQSHARKVFSYLDADERVGKARHVLRWIIREQKKSFTRRDCHHALEGTFRMAEELEEHLRLLTQRGYLRPLPQEDRNGPGRKPSPAYEVNPSAYTTLSTQSTN